MKTILTLDAGGTNFVFSAMAGGRSVAEAIVLPACADRLDACLDNIISGFSRVRDSLDCAPAAISFAFPGPADYPAGIIGDLPNFPSFRGGIPLGPILEDKFGIPVFINNDGKLFAYGEATAGVLPEVNRRLEESGSARQYRNLIGVTLGTGFGGGAVIDGRLLLGDNGTGGDLWCLPDSFETGCIAEESVSIRAVRRVYKTLSGDSRELTPYDIFRIAEGDTDGDAAAARASFGRLGKAAGATLATAATLIDGIIAVGGGVAGAAKYIIPALVAEMNSALRLLDGTSIGRMQAKVYDLDDPAQFALFAADDTEMIAVPGTSRAVPYRRAKKTGVAVSRMGAPAAISMGAYHFAINNLKTKNTIL